MIQKTSSSGERQLALCIFDDIVEHGKQLSFPLWESFIPFLLEYSQDPHNGVRQAACYGLGVCAQQGGDLFKPVFRPALEGLLRTIQKPNSRVDEKTASPTENAISSIGKLIAFQSANFVGNELQEIVNMWISWLPIEFDELEARSVHKQFCNLLMSQGALMFGPQSSNLPQILSVLAQCLSDPDLIEDPSLITQLLKRMKTEIPHQLEGAFSVLPTESQDILKTNISKP